MHPAILDGFVSELGAIAKEAALKAGIELQPHQQDAALRSKSTPGMILNWGVGSGKTIGSMAISEQRGGNVLVVVPASLRDNYQKQLHHSVTPDRIKKYTVISYDAFRKNPEAWVDSVKPNTLIADEVHRLRNDKPREAFERVRSKIPFMLGLTGSLVNNTPDEIVPLTNLVAGKHVFKSREDFDKTFIRQNQIRPGIWARLRGVGPGVIEEAQNQDQLKRLTAPYIHRFSGDPEYLKYVPEVKENRVEVEMNSRQEDMLKGLAASNPTMDYKLRHNLPPSKADLRNMNAFMTASRQISNTPQAYFNKPVPSPKLHRMFQDIQEQASKDPNFKAVVYSNFIESGIQPLLDTLKHSGISSEAFTGGLNDKQRGAMVQAFNKGKIRVLGLSPAGGEGLDLKGVKLVQLTEEHWNPERTRQAIGRSARFKSHEALPQEERKVQVNRYLAVHPPPGFFGRLFGGKRPTSPDEWIDARRQEKLKLNQSVVNAIPAFQRKAASMNPMMAAFQDELEKIADGAGGILAGLATGLPAGRSLAGDTAAEIAPHGRKTRSESIARAVAWGAAPVGGIAALALAKKFHLGDRAAGLLRKHFPTGMITHPETEQAILRQITPAATAFAGSAAGGTAAGLTVGGIQKMRGAPKGFGKKQKAEEKEVYASSFVDEIQKTAISGMKIWNALKSRILGSSAPMQKKMLALRGVVKGKIHPGELYPQDFIRINPEGAPMRVKETGRGASSRPVAKKIVNEVSSEFPKKLAAAFTDELGKLAVSPEYGVRALFRTAYEKGSKLVRPTIDRMAKTHVQTAANSGSPVTREGLKKWIGEYRTTGKI